MSWRKNLLLFVLLVPAFNLLTVQVLPTAVNHLVMKRIATRGLEGAHEPDARPEAQRRKAEVIARQAINVALPSPRANSDARTVVRPSPDLLYTACVFDLRHGPLHITTPVPDSYISVSGFGANSNNFFAVNDRNAVTDAEGHKHLDLVLSRDAETPVPRGARHIVAPSDRGLILFRTLITNEAALPVLQQDYQLQQHCDPL